MIKKNYCSFITVSTLECYIETTGKCYVDAYTFAYFFLFHEYNKIMEVAYFSICNRGKPNSLISSLS